MRIENIRLLPVPASLSAFARAALPFDLSAHAWVMKKFLKKKGTKAFIALYPKLTYDGAAAIYLFTCESPLYRELNRRLRERDRQALKDGFFPYTRLLFEGYRAMIQPKPRMVNRGVKKDLVQADPDSYQAGESVTLLPCLRATFFAALRGD